MPTIDLSTIVAHTTLENCLYNASGAKCMTQNELDALLQSNAGAIVTKSCTLQPREGNETPRYHELPWGSINSMGLPNLGIDFYLDYTSKHTEKPFFLSVAGLTLEENIAMLKMIEKSDNKSIVELNLSCPNIAGKPQTGYDFERTKEVLTQVFSFYTKPLGIKLPPYFDMVHFEQMAAIINQFPVQFVTCINSIGNALVIDTETETVVIKPKDGFGGIGGDYIKPTALANVRMFYTLLRKDIDIIGCGGVANGQDAFEHLLCGAAAVQIGTQLMREDTACFERITTELKAIMKTKGYHKISDFKGKLKTI